MNKISTKIFVTIYSCLLLNSFFLRNSYANEEYNPKKECVWFENYNKLDLNGKIECLIQENITKGYILNPSLVAQFGTEGHKLLIKKAYQSIKNANRSLSLVALLGRESLPLEYYRKVFSIYNHKKHLTAYENAFKRIAFDKIFTADVYEIATAESYKEAIKLWMETNPDTWREIAVGFKDNIAEGNNIKQTVSFLHAFYNDPASKRHSDFVLEQLVQAKDADVIPLLIDRLKNEGRAFDRRNAAYWLGQIGKSENVNKAQGKISSPSINTVSSANNIALIIPVLRDAMKKDPDSGVKLSAASALSNLGDTSGVKDVIPLLKDDDPDVQRESQRVLREITGENYGDNTKAWDKWLERYNRTHKQQKTMPMKPPTPVVVKSGFKKFKVASVKELYTTIYNQVPTSGAAYYEYHCTDKFIPFLPESFWTDNDQPSDEPIRMGYYLETKGPEGKGNYVITILKGRKNAMLMLLKEQDKTYSKAWEQKLDACDFYNVLVKDLFDTKTQYKLKAPKDLNIVISCTINDQAKMMIFKWNNKGGIEPLAFEKEGANKKMVRTQEVTSMVYPNDNIQQVVYIACFKHNCIVQSQMDIYVWYDGLFMALPPQSPEGFTPYTIYKEIWNSKEGKQGQYVGGKPTFE